MQKNKSIINFLFLFVLIIISFIRSPYIFTQGRFVSGDAFFYANALNNNWLYSLFLIHREAGYMNLFSNISSTLNSKLINIFYAPLFNVYFCFLLLLFIFYLIIFTKSSLFNNNYEKYLGSFIFLISPPFVFEIWLNNLNAQVYLGIITFLIIFAEYKKKSLLLYLPILFMAGLSGIYSCLMTPIYFLKFLINKNFKNLMTLLVLVFTSITQFSLIINSKISNDLSAGKIDFFISSNEFISYTYNVLIRTFFSGTFPNIIATNLNIVKEDKNLLLVLSIVILIITSYFLILFFKKIINSNKEDKFIYLSLIYLFFVSSFFVVVGGVNDIIAGRYAVIPGLSLILIIFKLSFTEEKRIISYISIFLLVCVFITGTIDYRNKKHITYFDCIQCPNWREEVLKFQNDENYKVRVWPYNENKRVFLNRKLY